MIGDTTVGKNSFIPRVVDISKAPSNHFIVLSSSEALEEGEMQQLDGHEMDSEVNIVTPDQAGPSLSDLLWVGAPSLISPIGVSSPPSHPNITRKKMAKSS